MSVRNQRSRWGACSSRRVITLNWRLIQMPATVRDYVIFHELMHIRHPNHSRRFWREVEGVCAWWREAERWLRVYRPRTAALRPHMKNEGLEQGHEGKRPFFLDGRRQAEALKKIVAGPSSEPSFSASACLRPSKKSECFSSWPCS